jgi:uncharacterized protein (TIRG00374 family)
VVDSLPAPLRRASNLAPKLLVSVVVGGGFAWLLERGGMPLVPSADAFAHLSWWAVPVAVLTQTLATYYRTCRWVYLLWPIAPGLSRKRVLGVGFIGFTAVIFLPLRSGEVVRPYLLARDGEVTFGQALGATAVERIVDGLVVATALFIALAVSTPLSPLPDHVGTLKLNIALVQTAAYAALALFVGAFASLVAFYRMRATMQRLIHSTIGKVSERLADLAIEKVERLTDGLKALPSRQHFLPFLGNTTLYAGVLGLGYWATLRGCGIPATFAETWVVLGVLSIAILVPAGPGFFGAFQLSIYCSLAMFFTESVTLGAGAAFVFIAYTSQLAVTLLSCLVGFFLMAGHPPLPAAARASASSGGSIG